MMIMIVDDGPDNLQLLRELCLQLPETRSVTFLDPLEALRWGMHHEPDLILVDYSMPSLDGVEFIHQMRRFPTCAATPILMITGSAQRSIRHAALEGGASDFLTKPIDRKEFLARARNMLALRAGQKALRDRAEWLAAEVDKATTAILERELDTIIRLSRAAEYRDPETGAHVLRMAHYGKLIAARLGHSEQEQEMLLRAAPMHDVGKVGIPDQILLKPGKLTADEMNCMRQHARIGHEILRNGPSPFLELGATIALAHHEKFDGSGYPQGLKGRHIPLAGRIVAVADVFDALTSTRPYKPAWPFERAIDFLLDQRGTHFDPECVDVFCVSLDEVQAIQARFQDEEQARADPA